MGFTKNEIIGIGRTSQRIRDQLIQRLRDKGIQNDDVLEVMRKMPRHLFVDDAMKEQSYKDDALPIGHGQTISQPFIVARMTEELLKGEMPKRVLEVGTGSGYQAAVLAVLVDAVFTVERIKELHLRSTALFKKMGFKNIHTQYSDGGWGWEQKAPYDAIIATCAPAEVPESLLLQLTEGGKLVLPLGEQEQQLTVIHRITESKFESESLEMVQFVPFLEGQA